MRLLAKTNATLPLNGDAGIPSTAVYRGVAVCSRSAYREAIRFGAWKWTQIDPRVLQMSPFEPPAHPHPFPIPDNFLPTGELQTFRAYGDAGSVVILHNTNRVSNKYLGVGSRRLQVYGLYEDRHAFVPDLSRARVLAHPSRVPFLRRWTRVNKARNLYVMCTPPPMVQEGRKSINVWCECQPEALNKHTPMDGCGFTNTARNIAIVTPVTLLRVKQVDEKLGMRLRLSDSDQTSDPLQERDKGCAIQPSKSQENQKR